MNVTHAKLLDEVKFINVLLELNTGDINSFVLDNEMRGTTRRYQLNVINDYGLANASDWYSASEMRTFLSGVVTGISRKGWIDKTKEG
jgi:hypothetical protein